MRLQYSKVKRGGVTANYWYGETEVITAKSVEAGLQIRFDLPSKGGGKTDVMVIVGVDDLRLLLKDIASTHPVLADAFTESAHVTVVSLMKQRGS